MSNETPFYLISEMRSTLAVVENCFEQMEHCYALQKKLAKLKECERKGDSTGIMLILTKYGSKNKFIDTIEHTLAKFGDKLEHFETYINELKKILEAKSYQCPKCHGSGNISRWEHIRERGIVQSILRSNPCNKCKGIGQIDIPPVAEIYVPLFLEMANKLLLSLKHFQKTFNAFTATY